MNRLQRLTGLSPLPDPSMRAAAPPPVEKIPLDSLRERLREPRGRPRFRLTTSAPELIATPPSSPSTCDRVCSYGRVRTDHHSLLVNQDGTVTLAFSVTSCKKVSSAVLSALHVDAVGKALEVRSTIFPSTAFLNPTDCVTPARWAMLLEHSGLASVYGDAYGGCMRGYPQQW